LVPVKYLRNGSKPLKIKWSSLNETLVFKMNNAEQDTASRATSKNQLVPVTQLKTLRDSYIDREARKVLMKSRYLQANNIETRSSNQKEEDLDHQFIIQPIKTLPAQRPPLFLNPIKLLDSIYDSTDPDYFDGSSLFATHYYEDAEED
jgi:hypothetical protein